MRYAYALRGRTAYGRGLPNSDTAALRHLLRRGVRKRCEALRSAAVGRVCKNERDTIPPSSI